MRPFMNRSKSRKGWIGKPFNRLSEYLAAVPGSLRGHLNADELARVALLAVTGGSGVFGVLNAIAISAGQIFPAPADSALAVAVFAVILECRRRLDHGQEAPGIDLRNRSR